MKNTIYIYAIFTFIVIYSCSTKNSNNLVELNISEHISNDTSAIEPTIVWNIKGDSINPTLKAKFKRSLSLPFQIDTNTLKKQSGEIIMDEDLLKKSDSALVNSELIQLRSSMVYEQNMDYHIYFLDKTEEVTKMSKSKYEDYLSRIDIGQTKVARAFVYGNLKISDSTELLIWYVKHNTYEACPYGYGIMYYGTLITSDQIQLSFPLAEHTGGGDPPVSSSLLVSINIDEKGIFQQDYYKLVTDEFEMGDGDYQLKTKNDYFERNAKIRRDTLEYFKDIVEP